MRQDKIQGNGDKTKQKDQGPDNEEDGPHKEKNQDTGGDDQKVTDDIDGTLQKAALPLLIGFINPKHLLDLCPAPQKDADAMGHILGGGGEILV